MRQDLTVAVLGPVTATLGDHQVALGTPRQRMVLTALTLRWGAAIPVDTLADLVWGGRPPPTSENTLQGYVSGLRRALEPGRPARAPAVHLVLEPQGYALRGISLDTETFEREVDAVGRELGNARDETGLLPQVSAVHAEALVQRLEGALALWRGEPYNELGGEPEAVAGRTRWEQLHVLALQHRAELEIRLGHEGRVAADLEPLVAAYPMHERLWALRALALARAGRQADALRTLSDIRNVLADELGIDPGPELVTLQAAVLEQDPRLGARRRTTRPRPAAVAALVGRSAELTRLTALHDDIVGRPEAPRFAVLTGEPGIGKTRLAGELAAHAEAAGTRVLTVRCPRDEGAPPLWPWSRLLAAAGAPAAATSVTDDPGARFRAWDEDVEALIATTTGRPTLAVVDDVHWADPSTVRVLTLLAGSDRSARLLVVVTWRSDARGLTDLSAALAGRHAVRIDLEGVSAADTAQLVADTGAAALHPDEAEAWRRRTGGNPFFVVELARARRESPDGPGVGDRTPVAVRDVVAQRLADLPEAVGHVLQVAAVLGRDVDVATVAAVSGDDDTRVVAALERATAAGVLNEVDIDRFRFTHDLVRDAARSGVTRTRGARLHAAAARALVGRGVPGAESDVARHWLAAGPNHASEAWRAAREAASAARRLYAYDEAVALLREALEAIGRDGNALPEDRCDLLIALADTTRLSGRWVEVRPVVHEALEVAHRLGDVERAFTAATTPTEGALWLGSPYGETDDVVVAALRRLLGDLPGGDDPLRCRVMLSLASEIYYAASSAERDALVDEAIAMAERLGDEALVLQAHLGGSRSIWRSARSAHQHRLATRAVTLAHALGDDLALADALTALAAVSSDLGTPTLLDDLARARTAAARHRLLFDTVAVDGIEIAWRTMRGETTEVERLVSDMSRALDRIAMSQLADTPVATEIVRLLWTGRHAELLDMLLRHVSQLRVPIQSFVAALYGRTGRADEAAAYVAAHDLRLEVDDWLSPGVWSMAAEAGSYTADREMAAAVYARLAPLAGRPATAGPSVIVGPVDAFLGMAAHTVGESATARRHLADAETVARSWDAPPVVRWVQRERVRLETAAQR